MPKPAKSKPRKSVETLVHDEAKRKNIPTAEHQAVVQKEQEQPRQARYERNRDLDPQLVWRGKDEQDWSDLVVHAPPLYIQEKVHPKALIDDLLRQTRESQHEAGNLTPDLFADFNGIPLGVDKTEFYQHDQNWSNRMILGDSLQVMASLAEREGLRGRVQCIYFDPPYGIKFNSNFQWSTTSRDVKDGNAGHITREPEQVKAFRDTWRDGIHSYLTYLRDRLTVARDLLTDSGSIFVQIGDENVHRVRAVMDEVFGEDNCVSPIHFQTTTGQAADILPRSGDYVLWYSKQRSLVKYRQLFREKQLGELASYSSAMSVIDGRVRKLSTDENSGLVPVEPGWKVYSAQNLRSQDSGSDQSRKFIYHNQEFDCGASHHWKTNPVPGMLRLANAGRIQINGNTPNYIRFVDDYPVTEFTNKWDDTAIAGFSGDKKRYVVETPTKVIQRCLLLATDPGDLVLDPTCGSGTTATVAEQWGRRWITIDTSRVALALARARIMGTRYPFYLLADSREGQLKEAEVTRTAPSSQPVQGSIRHGFVYERVPHITLKSIANNAEIDVIWDQWQAKLEPLREKLNAALKKTWSEWEIPREFDAHWTDAAKELHANWWQARVARQQEIDKSITAKAEFEYLYDKPYDDKKKVRVAGPFTVESLSPHRMLGVDDNDELIDPSVAESAADYAERQT
ncbi:MAG: site-specific DNA-methyltransferase, partial [Chthoniobacterales bacterium]